MCIERVKEIADISFLLPSHQSLEKKKEKGKKEKKKRETEEKNAQKEPRHVVFYMIVFVQS